jgi:hypothetical protein
MSNLIPAQPGTRAFVWYSNGVTAAYQVIGYRTSGTEISILVLTRDKGPRWLQSLPGIERTEFIDVSLDGENPWVRPDRMIPGDWPVTG